MSSISKEERLIIENMFRKFANADDMSLINKAILDAKLKKGIYHEVVNHGPNLHSLKNCIIGKIGLNQNSSEILAIALWGLVRPVIDRGRQSSIGIINVIWLYEDSLCLYKDHANYKGKLFNIKKGMKSGWFHRIHPGQLVGCGCHTKPVTPF
ncbi:TPA: hypothetical protein SMF43_001454 [Serratia marcescens]|nr:hypothetical protein [Serratia marcescens]